MKPGFPAAFGLAGDVPVFGLPGPPGAAMLAFEELVRPALRTMMGHRQVHPSWLPARLLAPITVRPGRRRYLWARAALADGPLVLQPPPPRATPPPAPVFWGWPAGGGPGGPGRGRGGGGGRWGARGGPRSPPPARGRCR